MPEGEHHALFWQPDQGRPWSKILAAIAVVLIVVGVVVFFVVGEDDPPAPDPAVAMVPAGGSGEPKHAPPQPAAPPGAQPAVQPAEPQPAEPQPAEPQPAEPQPAVPQPAEPQPAVPQPAVQPSEPPPSAPPAAAAGTDACVAKHFAPGAFSGEIPKFDFVCTRSDPRKGAIELSARLIYAQKKKPVTDAMKEWSILNWYELAFFAIVQRACCTERPALDTKVGTACDFDAKLTALGEAGHIGKDLDEAILAFDKSVQCLINFQLAAHYKQTHPTYGPERDAFKRISERSQKP